MGNFEKSATLAALTALALSACNEKEQAPKGQPAQVASNPSSINDNPAGVAGDVRDKLIEIDAQPDSKVVKDAAAPDSAPKKQLSPKELRQQKREQAKRVLNSKVRIVMTPVSGPTMDALYYGDTVLVDRDFVVEAAKKAGFKVGYEEGQCEIVISSSDGTGYGISAWTHDAGAKCGGNFVESATYNANPSLEQVLTPGDQIAGLLRMLHSRLRAAASPEPEIPRAEIDGSNVHCSEIDKLKAAMERPHADWKESGVNRIIEFCERRSKKRTKARRRGNK